MERILEEIAAERERQDGKWGGPDHDDTHTPFDWERWIKTYSAWARQMAEGGAHKKCRRRLIQTAALAVAAVESLDRICAQQAVEADADQRCACGSDVTFYATPAGCPVHGYNRFGSRS